MKKRRKKKDFSSLLPGKKDLSFSDYWRKGKKKRKSFLSCSNLGFLFVSNVNRLRIIHKKILSDQSVSCF